MAAQNQLSVQTVARRKSHQHVFLVESVPICGDFRHLNTMSSWLRSSLAQSFVLLAIQLPMLTFIVLHMKKPLNHAGRLQVNNKFL